jgi:hypothetical protein
MNYAPSQPGDRAPDRPELKERTNGDLHVLIEPKPPKEDILNGITFLAGIPREVKR